MNNVLLLGDYEDSYWHPLNGVDDEIKRILSGYEVTVCADYAGLTLEKLREYDVVVNYIDAWQKNGSATLAGTFLCYVAGGGAMLTIHNGIIAPGHPELGQMTGAAFTTHPPHEVIAYEAVGGHPITDAQEPFSIDEEPYQFNMDPLADVTMLMEYVYHGERYPAAWLRAFGSGKICYLSLGHNAESFKEAGFERLIKRSVMWLTGDERL